MQIILFILMFATVIVLAVGMGMMIKGGEFNRKYGNRMMIARVSLQAMAIGMLALLMLAGKP